MVAVRRIQAFERFAAVHRAEQPRICDVNGIYIFRISPNMGEIPGALAEAVVVGDERPVLAAVIGPIEPAFFRFDERVDDIRIGAGNGNADAAQRALGDAIAFDALPGGAVVEIENFFPVLAAVAGAKDAAFGVRAVGMAQGGDECDIGIRGMNDDFADVQGVLQTDVGPSLPGVIRTIDAVAERDISTDTSLAGSNIEDVGIGIRDSHAADRRGALLVEERIPRDAAVRGFPNATGHGAKVIGIRLAGDAGDGQDASPAKGTDQAPFHAGVRFRINGRGGSRTAGLLRANGDRYQKEENKSRKKELGKAVRRFQGRPPKNWNTKRQMVTLWRIGWKRFSFGHKLR